MAEESDLVKNHSLLASMLNSATSSVDDEQSKKREHHSDSSGMIVITLFRKFYFTDKLVAAVFRKYFNF